MRDAASTGPADFRLQQFCSKRLSSPLFAEGHIRRSFRPNGHNPHRNHQPTPDPAANRLPATTPTSSSHTPISNHPHALHTKKPARLRHRLPANYPPSTRPTRPDSHISTAHPRSHHTTSTHHHLPRAYLEPTPAFLTPRRQPVTNAHHKQSTRHQLDPPHPQAPPTAPTSTPINHHSPPPTPPPSPPPSLPPPPLLLPRSHCHTSALIRRLPAALVFSPELFTKQLGA